MSAGNGMSSVSTAATGAAPSSNVPSISERYTISYGPLSIRALCVGRQHGDFGRGGANQRVTGYGVPGRRGAGRGGSDLEDLETDAFHIVNGWKTLDQAVDLGQIQIATERPSGSIRTAGIRIQERIERGLGLPLRLMADRGMAVLRHAHLGFDGYPNHFHP